MKKTVSFNINPSQKKDSKTQQPLPNPRFNVATNLSAPQPQPNPSMPNQNINLRQSMFIPQAQNYNNSNNSQMTMSFGRPQNYGPNQQPNQNPIAQQPQNQYVFGRQSFQPNQNQVQSQSSTQPSIPQQNYPNQQRVFQNYQYQRNENFEKSLPQINQDFKDDEEVSDWKMKELIENSQLEKESAKSKNDFKSMIKLTLVPMKKIMKLKKGLEVQHMPIMCKFETAQPQNQQQNGGQGERKPIDIVCVIDRSGSMSSGSKWKNLVQTIDDLIEVLHPNDRLSIVSFESNASRDCPLLRMNKTGKGVVQGLMKQLRPGGSTNIGSGIYTALKVLNDRRQRNPVSSVLLLGDGQDDYGKKYIERCINHWEGPGKNVGSYTINTFGFGNDHDSNLMTWIADQKDGNFYFIEDVSKVGICFIDCLGQLFSVFASNVTINIRAQPPRHLSDVMISKAFGGEEMWRVTQNNVYQTTLLQVYQGMKKNYMIELELPPHQRDLQNNEKNCTLAVAWCQVNSTDGQQRVNFQSSLDVTILNPDEEVGGPVQENQEVIENYYRVKSADMLKKARYCADKQEYKKGKKYLKYKIYQIKKLEIYNQSEELKKITATLEQAIQRLEPFSYSNSGSHYMTNIIRSTTQQRSCPIYNDYNQNSCQKIMSRTITQTLQMRKSQQKPQKVVKSMIPMPPQLPKTLPILKPPQAPKLPIKQTK